MFEIEAVAFTVIMQFKISSSGTNFTTNIYICGFYFYDKIILIPQSFYPLHPVLEIKVRILPIHDKYLDQNKDCNINAQNQITSIIFDCKNKSIT